jgi:hypothetical protein
MYEGVYLERSRKPSVRDLSIDPRSLVFDSASGEAQHAQFASIAHDAKGNPPVNSLATRESAGSDSLAGLTQIDQLTRGSLGIFFRRPPARRCN